MRVPLSTALILVALAGVLLPGTARAGDAPPSVVMIVLDDVGYGSFGCYGSDRASTPNLDSLASQGIRFERFYVNAPSCTPSRAALLTGRYPHRFNLAEVVTDDSARGLPASVPTLPSLFRAAGYRTMHAGKWHLGRGACRPAAHGYAEVVWFRKDLGKSHRVPFLEDESGEIRQVPGHLTEILTGKALGFLDRMKEQEAPFLLSLWHFAAHLPLQPPARIEKLFPDSKAGRYQAMVAHADEQIGRLLERLESNGQAANTIVIVIGDNGAVPSIPGANAPFSGGKRGLGEGGIRTPFLLRWPGRIAAGGVPTPPAYGFDLLPTLANWAGVDLTGLSLDGVDRSAEWEGGPAGSARGPVFFDRKRDPRRDGESWAVMDGPYKLLAVRGRPRLFHEDDLRRERGRDDRSQLHPALVVRLSAAYDEWRVETAAIPLSVERTEGAVEPAGNTGHRFGEGGGLVVFSDAPLLDFADGDFALSLRVRANRLRPGRVLAGRAGSWELRIGARGRPVFEAVSPDGGKPRVLRASVSGALEESRWHRVTVTILNTRTHRAYAKLFVDGRATGKKRFNGFRAAATDAPLAIGGRSDGSGSFRGAIDDVRCFVAPLTPDQQALLER
ncbi:MAG: sulfatase-like hydrolase/transferase [Planctomycetota bacterium]